MTLGEIIKDYREANSMSMDTFSEKSGISKAYISLLEKNKHPKTGKPIAPSLQCIRQAADGMNVEFNELFSMLDGNVTVNYKSNTPVTTIEYQTNVKDNLSRRLLSYYSVMSKLSEKEQDKIFSILDSITDLELEKNKDTAESDK